MVAAQTLSPPHRLQMIGFWLLIKNMLSRILELPGAKALPRDKGISVGAALNVMRDDVESTLGWSADIVEIIALVITGGFAFRIMLSPNVWVTLGTFVPLFVIVIIAERMSKRIERVRQASREATGHVSGTLGDMFSAVQAIQVNNAEEQVVEHFRRLNEDRRQAMVQDRLFTGIVDSLAENTVTIGTGLVLLFSAIAMQNGSFSVGDFALFVAYIWPVTELMRSFGTLLAGYKQAGVSVDRMQMLMQVVSSPRRTRPTRPRPLASSARRWRRTFCSVSLNIRSLWNRPSIVPCWRKTSPIWMMGWPRRSAAWSAPVRRADSAHGRGAYVCAPAGVAGLRRSLKRSGCGDRAATVGAHLRR